MGCRISRIFWLTAVSFLLARAAISPPLHPRPTKKKTTKNLMMSDADPDPPNFTKTDLLQIVVPPVLVFHWEETVPVHGAKLSLLLELNRSSGNV